MEKNQIKLLKQLVPLESGKLVARTIGQRIVDKHSEVVEEMKKNYKTYSEKDLFFQEGKLSAYLEILEIVNKLQNQLEKGQK